jgi:hypothetical protein
VIRRTPALVAVLVAAGCAPAEPETLPPNAFAFGVFGDGPYRPTERGRFERVIEDVNAHQLAFFLHVGDVLWYPCSDEQLAERLRQINGIRHAVMYTPGDNEWTDCHRNRAGRFRPLERLAHLRKTYFATPSKSLGATPVSVESQSADSSWREFVENARWRRGGFLFATIHLVGSGNATERFDGRTAADDSAVVRRTAAALAWLDAAFAIATRDSLRGVVIAIHTNPRFGPRWRGGNPFQGFLDRLARHASVFAGQVVVIHGDTHEFHVDHPLAHPETGQPLANFTRLETYGSPDIGWVRVVVDSATGRVLEYEPRLMSRFSW